MVPGYCSRMPKKSGELLPRMVDEAKPPVAAPAASSGSASDYQRRPMTAGGNDPLQNSPVQDVQGGRITSSAAALGKHLTSQYFGECFDTGERLGVRGSGIAADVRGGAILRRNSTADRS